MPKTEVHNHFNAFLQENFKENVLVLSRRHLRSARRQAICKVECQAGLRGRRPFRPSRQNFRRTYLRVFEP